MDDDEHLIAEEQEVSGDAGEEGELSDPRVERILQHVDKSLQLDDALQAAVGAASGDLLLMQYRLRQALDETFLHSPDSLTALAEVMPAMHTYMKVSQQADRFLQLLLKFKTGNGGS